MVPSLFRSRTDPRRSGGEDATLQVTVAIEEDGAGGLQMRLLRASGSRPVPYQPPFRPDELRELETLICPGRHLLPPPRPPEAAAGGLEGNTARAPRGDPTHRLREIGTRLFRSLDHGPVGRALHRLADRDADARARIRLVLDPDRSRVRPLLDLPWELLHDPQARRFLARDTTCSVVRFLPLGDPRSPPRSPLPLEILLALAAPGNLAPLDLDGELQRVRDAWDGHGERVRIEACRVSEPLELRRRLQRGNFDILHFVGHGDFEPSTGEGRVLLGRPGERTNPVTGRSLASTLEGLPHLRLVVLNACDTGRSTGDARAREPGGSNAPSTSSGAGEADGREARDPWSGVATALVRGGLPAVVAMARPISDRAAVAFSGSFYRALADGRSVEEATVEGRHAIRTEEGSEAEWATPALYLQDDDGRLFDLRPAPLWPWGPRYRRPLAIATLAVLLLLLAFAYDPGFPYRAWMNPWECPSHPEIPLRFELIPAGSFPMGSEQGEEDEKPVHRAKIEEPFCMGKYEVTRRQWLEVMGVLPGVSDAELEAMVGDEAAPEAEDLELPVGRVTYRLAREFLDELNRRAGALEEPVYRLPTEAEWERAARAGTRTAYSFGDDPTELHRHGNCLPVEGAPQDRFEKAAPVGSFEPNAWGLYDMHGNLWEWVSTPYKPYAGDRGLDLDGAQRLGELLRRGGSYENRAYLCRSANRDPHDPERREQVNGLRVVREVARAGG